ncbi:hypothetical protein NIES2107_25750 [Nostoc carneum NIES-2107]|nr:hypothetical protein NIES2107_25750 [Nostoc carneum NIES-2107]
MKLIQRTANVLVMRYVPWGVWLCSSLIVLMGIVIPTKAELITLYCTRNLQQPTQGQCTLTKSNWLSQTQRTWQLKQITGANINFVGTNKNRNVYQIYLITTQEEVPFLSSIYEDELQSEVKQIQDFLKNTMQTRLTFQEDDRFLFYFMGMTMVVLGVGMNILLGGIVTLRLNKITGKLTMKKQGVLGTKTFECHLNQIHNVIVTSSKFRLTEYHVAMIVLKVGTALQKTNLWEILCSIVFQGMVGPVLLLRPPSLFLNRKRDYERCAEQILDFLHEGNYLN